MFLKADIFFLITSLSVLVVATFLVVALVYIIKILRTVKDEADSLVGDVNTVRKKLREDGIRWRHIVAFFSRGSGTKSHKDRGTRTS